jgi:hypothetical protein
MKEYTELKDKITNIIEQSNTDKPACKNCKRYCDGTCMTEKVNEMNGNGYIFRKAKVTTPDYSCGEFDVRYSISENTRDSLRTLLKDIERVNEGTMALDLFLSGKVNENELNEMLK